MHSWNLNLIVAAKVSVANILQYDICQECKCFAFALWVSTKDNATTDKEDTGIKIAATIGVRSP